MYFEVKVFVRKYISKRRRRKRRKKPIKYIQPNRPCKLINSMRCLFLTKMMSSRSFVRHNEWNGTIMSICIFLFQSIYIYRTQPYTQTQTHIHIRVARRFLWNQQIHCAMSYAWNSFPNESNRVNTMLECVSVFFWSLIRLELKQVWDSFSIFLFLSNVLVFFSS